MNLVTKNKRANNKVVVTNNFDVNHLGYKNLSKLVASYSNFLSVDNAKFIQTFTPGFVSKAKVET